MLRQTKNSFICSFHELFRIAEALHDFTSQINEEKTSGSYGRTLSKSQGSIGQVKESVDDAKSLNEKSHFDSMITQNHKLLFHYPKRLSSSNVVGGVETEGFTDSGIGLGRVRVPEPIVHVSSSVVIAGMSYSGVVAVMIQGERANRQEKDETERVVDDLEERLVSSGSAPQVRDEQREGHQKHATHCDQSDIVAIVERSCGDVTAKVQRVGANQDEADQGDNLYILVTQS